MHASLGDPKPIGQVFAKRTLFSISFTMKEKRRAWLNHLFKTRYKDSRASFMKETGYSKGRLTQLFDVDAQFGERASLELAARIKGLDPHYFENPLWPDGSNPVETRIAEMTAALREVQAMDPQRLDSLEANLKALVDSMKTTDEILRTSHGVTGYVTETRAAETLGAAPKLKRPQKRSEQRENLLGGSSGFGELQSDGGQPPARPGKK